MSHVALQQQSPTQQHAPQSKRPATTTHAKIHGVRNQVAVTAKDKNEAL